MEQTNNTNIFIIFLSFLMIVLSITSIELPWQRFILVFKILGSKVYDLIIDRELFDSGIYYPPREDSIWIEITSNSINNGIMTCMGINILSLVVILINPFKRFFKFISDSHYLFIEKILIRFLSVMTVIFYILSITIGLMLSGTYCQIMQSKFDSSGGSKTPADESCYSLNMFSKPHIQDMIFVVTEVSSKPMKGWYLSIVLLFLSLILVVIVFIRFKRISPNLVDLGYRHYLTKKNSSKNNDTGSSSEVISSNESDNIATVEIESLL
ncbi:hypothetical protein ACTFIZ_011561 [Dictyostelium cf. discoideum]